MHAARAMFRLRGGLFKHTSSVAGVALAAVAASASLSPDAKAETAIVAHHHSPTSSHWSTPWRSVTPQSSSTLALCKDMRQLYSVDSVIGRGGFGQVHEGRHKVSDAKVAIKRVCKQTTSKAKFLQEVDILRAVGGRHNVVELCEAFETADAYVLVTELVVGEELFDHLVTKGVLDAPRAQALVREIAQSLVYLHTHGVVHGDLKPENILLTAEANAIRLIDFGQSFREHNSSERSRCMGSGVATIAYAAPEVIASATSKTTATTTVDSAIDMWGLGVVLYIVLCGYHPFDPENSASDNELADRIVSGKYDTSSAEWEALPSAAQDLIQRLLQVDPSQRISADDVLAHEWLATAKA